MTYPINEVYNPIPKTLERMLVHLLKSVYPSVLTESELNLLAEYGYTLEDIWHNYIQTINKERGIVK